MNKIKKVLLLGSGALKIGEAGEFDYSGSQALKALKEEGIEAILINPNIATIQTSHELASKVYFLPVSPYFVEKVIAKEKPDSIMLSFGGQTALNCGLELDKTGVLKKYQVQVLGSPVKSIQLTEDRELFAKELAKIRISPEKVGVKVPKGGFATTVNQGLTLGKKLGFPLMVRSGYALGGLGSAVVENDQELDKVLNVALKNAPQVAIEEYLKHWKEIEYEIVRDKNGNKITVCNMENMDPLGVHTGESIVVAPSQTLNNYQYHYLRKLSLKVIEHLQIVGECNIQFALNPKNNDYRVIEVNARLSRSSALASKATGYPLAYIAAKLGLGYTLPELKNSVTQSTSAFFEPALDYIVVKIPRWDLQKFIHAEDQIGSAMKSVGEVMAIGRSFPEALQKAIRSLEIGHDGLLNGSRSKAKTGAVLKKFLSPSTKRLFMLASQLADGLSIEKVYQLTGIDFWFLHQIKQIVDFESQLSDSKLELNQATVLAAKKLGFSDRLLGIKFSLPEKDIRNLRKKWGILPKVKHIDTLAAEYPAKTNYLYLTYHGEENESFIAGPASSVSQRASSLTSFAAASRLDPSLLSPANNITKAIVLGSGPYRIGSSVEFDWCSVTATQTLRKNGIEAIIVNCNPETVSTDFDSADKLYFEELTFERVSDIADIEQGASLVLAFGGQVPNNLALKLDKAGYPILGTNSDSIDNAEDRHKFSSLLDRLGIIQPEWRQLQSTKDATGFSKKIGYPVLIRPSYVLSGSAMNVAYAVEELKKYLNDAALVSPEFPVVISKYIDNSKEVEIDGVAQNGRMVIYAISEHVENAGVHSGDATLVLPPQRLYLETVRQIKMATARIVKALNITGPFNIQYLAKDNKVMVIELNLRASRSFPFVSKVTGHNFVEIATRVMLGEEIKEKFNTIDLDHVGVKASQFSFNRIKGADPKLRVEMSSTGEVGCFGENLDEAYLKALLSTGMKLPQKSIFLSIGGDKNKVDFLESARRLYDMGLKIYATEQTSNFFNDSGIANARVYKISENKSPTVLDLFNQGKIDMVIVISASGSGQRDITSRKKSETDGFIIRRNCVDYGIPLVTNLQSAVALASAMSSTKMDDLEIKSWDEYVN